MVPGGTVSDRPSTAVCAENRLVTRSTTRVGLVMAPAGKRVTTALGSAGGSYSVETRAAVVCGNARGTVAQGRVAHLPRAGNRRSPARAAGLPSRVVSTAASAGAV